MRQPSLFASFNARALQPEQVGRGFIYSSQFGEVSNNANTIVLGPRGSGKTTLLKMLTLPALRAWHLSKHGGSEAIEVIRRLEFVALYVPSDFTWYPDFRRPVTATPPKEVDDLLSYALFRNHVLLAICESLDYMASPDIRGDKYLNRFSIDPDEVKADTVAKLLADAWGLSLSLGGVFGLKRSVANRIRQIQRLLTQTAIRPITVDQLLHEYEYLSDAFFDDLKEFADIFGHVYKLQHRWAACFDEVEIAPDPVKLPIWQSGRSFDPRFFVKLSASPFDRDLETLRSPKMPMVGQDVVEVDLSVQSRSEILSFSRKLFSRMCSEYRIGDNRAEILLGPSFYDDNFDPNSDGHEEELPSQQHSEESTQIGRLSPTGFYSRKFESLSRKDPSFRLYLERRKIDLNDMRRLSEFSRAAQIRKIISVVVVRDEFLFEKGEGAGRESERRFRARKIVPKVYTGAQSLFTLCEGNPRWLIGLLRPLVDEFAVSEQKVISRSLQAKRIERSITTLFTLLSTLRSKPDPRALSIIDLVERLGDFCFDQVLGERFNPEPATSFIVNVEPGSDMYDAIGRAINQGALVLVPSRPSSNALQQQAFAPGDIRGRRVRLAFLLAPRYRLPLVLGRPVDITPVLHGREKCPSEEQLILNDLFTTPIETTP